MKEVFAGIGVIVALAIVVGALLYGVVDGRNRTAERFSTCVNSGGQFITMNGGWVCIGSNGITSGD